MPQVRNDAKEDADMKVILSQDVKGLGKKGDMVEASDGYARNFLLPKKLAVEANAANINEMNIRKESEKAKKEKELQQAKALADNLRGKTVVIRAKSGENGKLFGSITNKDVADAIKAQMKVDIDKKKLIMPDAIKTIGSVEVDIKLYPEVSTKITVRVVQE